MWSWDCYELRLLIYVLCIPYIEVSLLFLKNIMDLFNEMLWNGEIAGLYDHEIEPRLLWDVGKCDRGIDPLYPALHSERQIFQISKSNIKISKCSKYSKYQNMIEALVPCFQRYIQIFQVSKELKVRGPPGFNPIFHHCHCLGQHFIASHQTFHIVLVSIY